MKKQKYQISNRQLIFIIVHICVGTGILSLPRTISEISKQDSLIAIILGATIWVYIIFIIIKLNSRFPNDTIIEYSRKLVGEFFTYLISFIFITYSILIASIITRIFITVLSSFSLPKTPIIYTSSILIILCQYLNNQGLKTIARLDEFLFFSLSPVFIVMLPVILNINWLNYQPFMGTGIKTIIKGSYTTIFSFVGPEIILVIFPFIQNKTKSLKYSLLGFGMVILTYLFVVAISIGFYGVEPLLYMVWPTINILKALKIPFFGRLEFIFIFFWIAVAFTSVASYFYISSFSLSKVFKIDKNKIGLVLMPIIFYLSLLPNDIIQVYEYSELIGKIGLLFSLTIPTILLIISYVRGIKDV